MNATEIVLTQIMRERLLEVNERLTALQEANAELQARVARLERLAGVLPPGHRATCALQDCKAADCPNHGWLGGLDPR